MPDLIDKEIFINGTIADANQVNTQINNILIGHNEGIKINEGKAFIISDSLTSFVLTPLTNNVSFDNLDTQDKEKLDDRRITLNLENIYSGIDSIELGIENQSQINDGTIEVSVIDSVSMDTIQKSQIVIPKLTPMANYLFPITQQNLAPGLYFIEIKSNIDNIFYKIDKNSTLGGITYIEENSLPENYDLGIKILRCNEVALDITSGEALINGIKTANVDTHINVELGSDIYDRIDVITLNENGRLNIYRGEESNKPEIPRIPDDELPLAKMYIEAKQSNLNNIVIEDIALRSMPYRMSEIEKNFKIQKLLNSFKRLSWKLSPVTVDSVNSGGIVLDSAGNVSFDLSTNETVVDYMSNLTNINDTSKSQNLEISNKTIRIKHDGEKDFYFDSNTYQAGARDWRDITCEVPYDIKTKKFNVKYSRYCAGYYIPTENITLNEFTVKMRNVVNADKIRCYLFRVDTDEIGMRYMKYIDRDLKNNGFKSSTNITFSGWNVKLLQNERYALVFVPFYKDKKACTLGLYGQANDQADKAQAKNTFLQYYGLYKPSSSKNTYSESAKKKGYNNLGLRVDRRYTGSKLYIKIKGKENVYKSTATFVSKVKTIGSNIKSLTYDLNIKLPTQTDFRIEFTNNNWTSYKVGNNGRVVFDSTGNKFAYRIILISKDGKSTPTIAPDADVLDSSYLIKCNLAIDAATQGQALSSGYFRTPTFNANSTINSLIGVNAFSNIEWFRLWMNPNGADVFMDFEGVATSPSSRNDWKYSIINVPLSDFFKGDIDFDDDIIPENEYNLRFGGSDGSSSEHTLIASNVTSTDLTNNYNKHESFNMVAESGAIKLTPNNNLEVGNIVMWRSVTPFDMLDYKSFMIELAVENSNQNWEGIKKDTYQLVFSKSEDCSSEDYVFGLKEFDKGSPFNTNFVKCFSLIKNIKSRNEIKSIGIKYNENVNSISNGGVSVTPTIFIKNLKMLTLETVPFYFPFFRMRFNINKHTVKNPNPIISGIGAEYLLY